MSEFGAFKDERDGYVYKTVRIGNQTWLAENFRYDCAGSFVCENEKKHLERYGRLYTWYSAVNASPEGWRLPSRDDWDILTKSVGGEDVEGKVLKSREGWKKDGNGTDKFGFCALPGGFGGSGGSFYNVGYYGYWWSASEYDSYGAYSRGMTYYLESANWYHYGKSALFSVRYLQERRIIAEPDIRIAKGLPAAKPAKEIAGAVCLGKQEENMTDEKLMACTHCGSRDSAPYSWYTDKSGDRHRNWRCRSCGRNFCEKPRKYSFEQKKEAIDRFLESGSGKEAARLAKCSPGQIVKWKREFVEYGLLDKTHAPRTNGRRMA